MKYVIENPPKWDNSNGVVGIVSKHVSKTHVKEASVNRFNISLRYEALTCISSSNRPNCVDQYRASKFGLEKCRSRRWLGDEIGIEGNRMPRDGDVEYLRSSVAKINIHAIFPSALGDRLPALEASLARKRVKDGYDRNRVVT